jgi:hypothetical protein
LARAKRKLKEDTLFPLIFSYINFFKNLNLFFMEYYDSYYDEDFDEAIVEDYDESFEDYDESFEDYYEGEDYGESRRSSRRPRSRGSRGRGSGRSGRGGRRRMPGRGGMPGRRPIGSGKPRNVPASSEAVGNAFRNVQEDMSETQKIVKRAEIRQSHEQMNEIIAPILLRPKLFTGEAKIFKKDANDNFVLADDEYRIQLVDDENKPIQEDGKPSKFGYKMEDNLLAQVAVKVLSNMKGTESPKGFGKYLPLSAGLLLSPTALKDLGIGGGGDKSSSSGSNNILGNLTASPAVLILLLFYVLNK